MYKAVESVSVLSLEVESSGSPWGNNASLRYRLGRTYRLGCTYETL